ncbi:thiamine phosphate synthase [Salinicola endophyticus]|uniref:Thiamine-phosphate synthase n=1 Tax=Salinicola endophyticus TaxID=1949083 RepID=A0AB74UCW4_9GAMM
MSTPSGGMSGALPHGLYAITDSQLLADDRTLLAACEQALAAGVVLLQYRDKSADAERRWRQATALAALGERFGVTLIVNDDLALAERLQQRWGERVGLHLGQQDTPLALARQRLGDTAIIGATCHASLTLAAQAADAGASYLAFGRFFASRTKPEAPPAPLSVLGEAARFGLPRVAIGGIEAATIGAAREAGAELLAVVNAIFASPDIAAAVRALDARLAPISEFRNC